MSKDVVEISEIRGRSDARDAAQDPDYLTYANIRQLIDQHLEERSLMLDVQTRYLLSQLSATAGARAERKRAEIEAAIRPGRDVGGD